MNDATLELMTTAANEAATAIEMNLENYGINITKILGSDYHGELVELIFAKIEVMVSDLGEG